MFIEFTVALNFFKWKLVKLKSSEFCKAIKKSYDETAKFSKVMTLKSCNKSLDWERSERLIFWSDNNRISQNAELINRYFSVILTRTTSMDTATVTGTDTGMDSGMESIEISSQILAKPSVNEIKFWWKRKQSKFCFE
jgi:hypothetical protein